MEPRITAPDGAAPGTVLRQARTERGLSVDEVAQALRLSPRIVSALEDEAYDRLPGPTYVRGYLRSYAQFLGLSPRQLIEGYNNRPEAHRRMEMTGPAAVRQVTSSDALMRLGSVLVVVIVFGLVALWWSGHQPSGVRFRSEPPAVEPLAEPTPVPVPGPIPDVSEPTAPVPLPGETVERPSTAPEAAVPETATPEATTPETATPESPSAPAIASAPARDPGVSLARVVLYVHEDCWADVRDASGERLLYETIPAGRVVTVQGEAPISVFLGNVDGVTVEFNGEEYDALRHRRGRIARFTLGARSG